MNAPTHLETFTGAAIDAARINTSTAQILVSMDSTLDDEQRAEILHHLERGLEWLHAARELMPAQDVTSVHVVKPGGLIVPP